MIEEFMNVLPRTNSHEGKKLKKSATKVTPKDTYGLV